ncbi:hypothetical protein IPC1147_29185 [Pseudomonas aeruginosa]|uniref:TetR/AcrR family transcriptional regulator n=1 Tax=Pseudomonas aeruginosa TaxID=287 RepID=UPI000FFED933|nr:TetR/AcrR family transcriptional regulator [Pseudomonas aeruginosa]MBG4604163.1 TetR/AcrR family transcriptional regulator [Pseudomonas aeruginosa]MBH8257454.1 TetR/AcrR family transcriptional regulator [Pseudomonas aeruginosa]MCV3907761.1 TetR/AcrR family transcriptional regulator [Pseudomonas aeruginosa]NPS39669.1 TetR/AcrR family transcriptional regulator [Pseudomonas aeruginosa]NPS89141.1 TetR/AcrR family transcriptional regulator [Pseudomonas aeruginosa]
MAIRKRDRTRSKLLIAAQQLALESGAAALTVLNLTERAEVALGTFYNYYRTREDVLDDLRELLIAASRNDVTQVIEGLSSPVAIVAASVRQTLHLALPGTDMGRLLFDSDLPMHEFIVGLRQFFKRDLEAGMRSGEFRISNEVAVISMVSGISFGTMQDIYRGALSVEMIDDITEMTLRLLGAEAEVAEVEARRPIKLCPPIKLPLCATDLLAPLGAAPK